MKQDVWTNSRSLPRRRLCHRLRRRRAADALHHRGRLPREDVQGSGLPSVVVDLSKTENIDSTSLGLLAKLSIQADKRFASARRWSAPAGHHPDPAVHGVRRGVQSGGEAARAQGAAGRAALLVAASEEDVRQRVLDAHRTLMSMNEANRDHFSRSGGRARSGRRSRRSRDALRWRWR